MKRVIMSVAIAAILLGPVLLSDTSRLAYATAPVIPFPNTGAAGDLISYSISGGATASTPYTIQFDATTVASGTTTSAGAASGTFTIPTNATAGAHNIIFRDGIAADTTGSVIDVLSSSSSSNSMVTGSVTIAGTCGLSIPGQASLNYGRLVSGAPSGAIPLTLDNTGTGSAMLLAFGSNWLDSKNNNLIDVGNTKWSISNPGPTFTGLTSTPATLTNNFAPGTLQTFWELTANLNNSTFQGSLTQSISLTVSC